MMELSNEVEQEANDTAPERQWKLEMKMRPLYSMCT